MLRSRCPKQNEYFVDFLIYIALFGLFFLKLVFRLYILVSAFVSSWLCVCVLIFVF